ncbi:hypothetical protein CO230_09325 [Chryseobacterium sp. 6424]|nr:hypothetical protein CO230_09325 [Chryseobacterium sp. 6424]
MLNNALMTIEALAKLKSVSEVSPLVLKQLCNSVDLKEINKRLKSYTMIFSLNNPLVNPAKKANNAGENTYHHLLNAIMDGFESDGERVCEISGLRFNKSFQDFYKEEIERQKKILVATSRDAKQLNKELKNIENTDTSLNRSWFPLIGGLGSDAQALPQAKYPIQIHPICIAILQFLPLSALLYKGGILLVDSSNFELSREMIAQSVKTVSEKIQGASSAESIENIRDFAKGDYLLKALAILTEKEDLEETYSDLNLWSFSNSGTGASCEIDRVPNALIRKLQRLIRNPSISPELKGILSRNESAYSFIESLGGSKDWFLLYPNVFGSGKKKVEYEGVSPGFIEVYYEEIGKANLIPTAKYIARLIKKYKSKSFEKLLEKTDAWNDSEYKIELFKVLVKATENHEWSLEQQIAILDHKNELPIKNNFYQYQKLIHYFTQKEVTSKEIPNINIEYSKVFEACKWIVSLIQKDEKVNTITFNLTNPNENQKVGFSRIILDALNYTEITLEEIVEIFYDEDYNFKKYGLNELLRIFFSQSDQQSFEFHNLRNLSITADIFQRWLNRIREFATDYQTYFYANNFNFETGKPSYKKFERTINSLVTENDNFYALLTEIIYNTNQHLKEMEQTKEDKWSIEDLMTNPLGNSNRNICILAIKFLLKQTSVQSSKELLTHIN